MGKNTHFTGQPLYSQPLKFTNKQKIQSLSGKGGHDRYVKKSDGYSHFVTMFMAYLCAMIL